MSASWVTIIWLTVFTVAIKAVGPVALGGRNLPALFMKVIKFLAPAILAALTAVGTFTDGGGNLVIDARTAGLAAAGVVFVRDRKALVVAGVAAAVTAALVRVIA